MIPKIIHYCWFGGSEKKPEVKEYIDSWKKCLPDYQIREWNESNFDVQSSCDYVREAYEKKNWAFVTDYVRLYALYQYGGIYLDTDVEVIKSYNPLLSANAFIGAESEYSMCTATIGSEAHSPFISRLLDLYKDKHFVQDDGTTTEIPNSQLIFKLLEREDGYKASNKVFTTRDCIIYPTDYFSPLSCYTMRLNKTENTYSVHYYAGTWKNSKTKFKDKVEVLVTRIIGEKSREKIKRFVKKGC